MFIIIASATQDITPQPHNAPPSQPAKRPSSSAHSYILEHRPTAQVRSVELNHTSFAHRTRWHPTQHSRAATGWTKTSLPGPRGSITRASVRLQTMRRDSQCRGELRKVWMSQSPPLLIASDTYGDAASEDQARPSTHSSIDSTNASEMVARLPPLIIAESARRSPAAYGAAW